MRWLVLPSNKRFERDVVTPVYLSLTSDVQFCKVAHVVKCTCPFCQTYIFTGWRMGPRRTRHISCQGWSSKHVTYLHTTGNRLLTIVEYEPS